MPMLVRRCFLLFSWGGMGFSYSQKSFLLSSKHRNEANRYENKDTPQTVTGGGEPQQQGSQVVAVPPRVRPDYHYLMKLLLVGDAG